MLIMLKVYKCFFIFNNLYNFNNKIYKMRRNTSTNILGSNYTQGMKENNIKQKNIDLKKNISSN